MDTFTPDHQEMIDAYQNFIFNEDFSIDTYRKVSFLESRLGEVDAELCKIEAMAQVQLAVND
jgi:hypothetical protein